MTDTTFDPSAHDVDETNAYLATADQDERARVLAAEASADKPRKGVLEGPYGTDQVKTAEKDPEAVTQPVGSGAEDQEGAPQALSEAVKESEELGYVAPEQNPLKPSKPDYSQANPDVMNGGA